MAGDDGVRLASLVDKAPIAAMCRALNARPIRGTLRMLSAAWLNITHMSVPEA